ncbi:hypothetical protein [Acetobacter oeni]|uniref:Uncharacterized protein n=1 Tax=Acetobacter oeni TaxID=304077 RepID=A0A511XNA7_9PROT|nr:hypothetical protein [Acetobacter oeni]MBB3884275.1 putative membrane protein YgcG [Acetobacter oeni]NHO20206.1 hypothetical protein [Acetobacter oeni]GBR05655.1 hypothetical protein AA21952_1789 [Acetobacter oeni LMG 21952]GEN64405.1 hypothetical protein AOE01nite_26290 [Acetobacter oeni]
MRTLDFSSWHSVLATAIGLGLFTLTGVGVRLVMMLTIQQRRERLNRQINERLRTLIAAYKTLGGSFTGDLSVDPTHRRDMKLRNGSSDEAAPLDLSGGSDRARRIRDAVEAALSDVILLGTGEHVRMAARAATELAEGRAVHTHELVVALRNFIRKALDLDPVPSDLLLPKQGPTRPSGSGGRDKGEVGRDGGGKGGGADGGGMGGGGGMDNDPEPLSGHHS